MKIALFVQTNFCAEAEDSQRNERVFAGFLSFHFF